MAIWHARRRGRALDHVCVCVCEEREDQYQTAVEALRSEREEVKHLAAQVLQEREGFISCL